MQAYLLWQLSPKLLKHLFPTDGERLKVLDGYIGNLVLESIHMGTLQPYIEARQKEGLKTRTINHGLQIVRHVLNLVASETIRRATKIEDRISPGQNYAANAKNCSNTGEFFASTCCPFFSIWQSSIPAKVDVAE